jgi:hypothetical protein
MQQKRISPNRQEITWEVDLAFLKQQLPHYRWLADGSLLARDITEIGQYLPYWILIAGQGSGQTITSPCCQTYLIPTNQAWHCLYCQQPCQTLASSKINTLTWWGLLPVNLEGRKNALHKILTAQAQGKLRAPLITPQGKRHLLVPILVEYPQHWSEVPPQAHYADQEYLSALEITNGYYNNFQTHILGQRTICLYHGVPWNDNNTIMQVIANRIAPHAFALLQLADERRSASFFTTDYSPADRYYF